MSNVYDMDGKKKVIITEESLVNITIARENYKCITKRNCS